MTYFINPIWFYLMNVSTGLKIFLCVVGGILAVIMTFAFFMLVTDGGYDLSDLEESEKKVVSMFKKFIITGFVMLVIGLFVPSKETCIEMMIASQVTHENVTATKEEIYEIIDYVTDKVKGESE